MADSNLLLVGGGYADWLARLFLRIAKGEHRLSDARSVREYIAAAKAPLDANFVLFIQHFSKPTRLYADADPVAFVSELHGRWCERNPGKLLSNIQERREKAIVRPLDEMPDDAVFISYARADVAAVRNLYNGLTTHGIKAWFDFDRLEAEVEEEHLNENYRQLRNLLDEAGKESLRVEELAWLKKRDAIKNPQEKLEFTSARVNELQDRIEKLRK